MGAIEAASPTDESLFVRFRDGLDDESFRALMDRHFDPAFAFARGMLRDPAAAEDVVQEAFLRTIRARRSFDPARPFRTWFYHIVRNCCIDELRRRGKEPASATDPVLEAVPREPSGLDAADADELRMLIERLSDLTREALVLRYWSGLSFEEVAAACGCSVEAAKKRVQRALKGLREMLSLSKVPAVYARGGEAAGGGSVFTEDE